MCLKSGVLVMSGTEHRWQLVGDDLPVEVYPFISYRGNMDTLQEITLLKIRTGDTF